MVTLFGPPTVVFGGKRGVGKSSTLNRLFDLGLATDAAVECTLEPHVAVIDDDGGRRMRVVDMPGIAANLTSAARFGRAYRTWLRRADVFVWITQADVRSYTQDQRFLRAHAGRLRRRVRVVIAVSKADALVDPAAPDTALLTAKVDDVRAELVPFLPPVAQIEIEPYSVAADWHVDTLRGLIAPPVPSTTRSAS